MAWPLLIFDNKIFNLNSDDNLILLDVLESVSRFNFPDARSLQPIAPICNEEKNGSVDAS